MKYVREMKRLKSSTEEPVIFGLAMFSEDVSILKDSP